jgi:peptidyl-tRNA hydrolase, PTH1 family
MPLIVGLGNPGTEYEGTPHNVGFEVVARLARRWNLKLRKSRGGEAEEAALPGTPRVVLLRPLSYMNLSGRPVSAAMRWHGFEPADLMIVCDDVNLPLGHLRIRTQGGAGGQKGLRSIIENLGTDEMARLRIGVGGGDPGADVARHVLRKFPGAQRDQIDQALEQAADAVECWLRDGLETAMNRFNTKRSIEKIEHPSGGNRPSDNVSPKGDA